MKFFQKKQNVLITRNQGFTLFIAVLISALLLSIGLSLASFALRQTVISSIGRESQFAFFAADSGVECALYWDFKSGSETFFPSSPASVLPSDGFLCNGQDISPNGSKITVGNDGVSDFGISRFAFNLGTRCVAVKVDKRFIPPAQVNTIIESRGYNIGSVDASGFGCILTGASTRQVERALRVTY